MFKWRVVAQLVSPMGYTASSLGNHEFDDGVSDLVAFLDATDPAFPTVACNLDLSTEPELRRRMRGHVVRPVPRPDGGRDVLVGIVGYVTPETKDLASTGSVVFLDEVEALRREVGELKRKGVGVIVAVGHSGYRTDLKIAEEVRLKRKTFPTLLLLLFLSSIRCRFYRSMKVKTIRIELMDSTTFNESSSFVMLKERKKKKSHLFSPPSYHTLPPFLQTGISSLTLMQT